MSNYFWNITCIRRKSCWKLLLPGRWSWVSLPPWWPKLFELHKWCTRNSCLPIWCRVWTMGECPTFFSSWPQCPVCSVLCFNQGDSDDDTWKDCVPFLMDSWILRLPDDRKTFPSSRKIRMCWSQSTVYTWQYKWHKWSFVLPCWSSVCWHMSSLHTWKRAHMHCVYQVTQHFVDRWCTEVKAYPATIGLSYVCCIVCYLLLLPFNNYCLFYYTPGRGKIVPRKVM